MSHKPFKMSIVVCLCQFWISNVSSRLMLLQHLHDSCPCFAAISHSPVLRPSARTKKHTRPKPWRITFLFNSGRSTEMWFVMGFVPELCLHSVWSLRLRPAVGSVAPNDFWGRRISAFFHSVFTKLAAKLSRVFIMPFHFWTMCLGDTTECSETSKSPSYTKGRHSFRLTASTAVAVYSPLLYYFSSGIKKWKSKPQKNLWSFLTCHEMPPFINTSLHHNILFGKSTAK